MTIEDVLTKTFWSMIKTTIFTLKRSGRHLLKIFDQMEYIGLNEDVWKMCSKDEDEKHF